MTALENGHMDGFKGEATIAFLSYALRLEDNAGKLPSTFFSTVRSSPALVSILYRVFKPGTQRLKSFYEPLKRAGLDAFRHRYWFLVYASDIDAMMRLWIGTVSALPHTNDITESVIDNAPANGILG